MTTKTLEQAIEALIWRFERDYEMTDGEGAYYQPNHKDMALLEDAINGFVSELFDHDMIHEAHAMIAASRKGE